MVRWSNSEQPASAARASQTASVQGRSSFDPAACQTVQPFPHTRHPSASTISGPASDHSKTHRAASMQITQIQPTTSRSPNQKANSNSDPTTKPRAARENSRRQVHHTQLHRAPAAPFAGHDSGVPIVSSRPGPRQQITSASEQNSVAQRAGTPTESSQP
ncbi:hypothetical protein ACLOJK_029457, partial [Asimina triloba]